MFGFVPHGISPANWLEMVPEIYHRPGPAELHYRPSYPDLSHTANFVRRDRMGFTPYA